MAVDGFDEMFRAFEEWKKTQEAFVCVQEVWMAAYRAGEASAIANERERCAKICDERADTYLNPPINGNEFIAGYIEEELRLCAASIRRETIGQAEFKAKKRAEVSDGAKREVL